MTFQLDDVCWFVKIYSVKGCQLSLTDKDIYKFENSEKGSILTIGTHVK